ncbi:DUF2963 domain-containing protein [New Jersey aster yellows phytoplasma]|uniref:DUF2963 domain-containing protein n=1 Tax=New Jersey aster yellows phytoplasma TaxID=270520 RepID=A0ABX4K0W8_9MOLU|nr:DUF2963 domain-containing protein [New Jersey aster yellows phytoplasma]PEH36392.1 hypothetical protein BBA70_00730 [New Jersey aster yellows phytoplasma]
MKYIIYDGKIIKQIKEYNENGKLIKLTNFHDDGKKIDMMQEYDPQTGFLKSSTYYQIDGKK